MSVTEILWVSLISQRRSDAFSMGTQWQGHKLSKNSRAGPSEVTPEGVRHSVGVPGTAGSLPEEQEGACFQTRGAFAPREHTSIGSGSPSHSDLMHL